MLVAFSASKLSLTHKHCGRSKHEHGLVTDDERDARDLYDRGMEVRRAVLGDDYVDQSLATATDDLAVALQTLVTEFCWGTIWTREGFSRRDRSLLNLGLLIGLDRPHELRIHVRGALRNGVTRDELGEVVLQSAVYAGVPAALDAARVVRAVLRDEDEQSKDRS